MNRNVGENAKIGEKHRRESSSSTATSVASHDESMIMMRKKYKEIGGKSHDLTRKVYSKRILESTEAPVPEHENKEEFCKYLGIDTKPPEMRIYRPEITNLDIFKRRSLRVRYLKIQSQSQDQEPPVKSENKSVTKENDEKCEKTPEKTDTRPHDVKVLRSYLKPKEKYFEKNHENSSQTSSKRQNVKLPEEPVKYLMRSKINLSETRRLRSGLQRKQKLLRSSRYLSHFKNKRARIMQQKQQLKVKSVTKTKKIESQANSTKENVDLPKSPVPQVPDSTVNLQSPTIYESEVTEHISTSTIDLNSVAHTLKNPLNHDDGVVLFAYVKEDTLVIVQEKSVSFWRYSPFKLLVGLDQTWELIGRTKRHDYGK